MLFSPLDCVALQLGRFSAFAVLILQVWLSATACPAITRSDAVRVESVASEIDSVFVVGEELTYNVSYASVDIGQVRIKVVDKVQRGGKTSYKTLAYIDSYRGVPFVNIHTTYESLISESLYSRWFQARVKDGSSWHRFVYNYDYPHGSVSIEQTDETSGRVEKRDTLHIESPYQDGLSMFYLARCRIQSSQPVNVPVVVNERKGSAFLDFKNERKNETIDAVDYPLNVTYFSGRADFVGIFGLTGEFEGWFSNDGARVPILAKMKVLLGNIRIELMKWKREGWSPPRYYEADHK